MLSVSGLKRKSTHELTDHAAVPRLMAPRMHPEPQPQPIFCLGAHSLSRLSAKGSNEDTFVSCRLPWLPTEGPAQQRETPEADGGLQAAAAAALLPPMHLLAVFDGHSSSTVSTMAAEQLPGLLTQLLLQEAATAADIDALMPRLLHEAFQQLDDAIKPLDNAGSTASVAVITPQRVHLGWVGDSRAVLLGRGGHVLGFTQEHRATREDEQERVAAAGGSVFNNSGLRVMGILQCTRAIGDKDLQPYGVTPTPDVLSLPRTGQEEFLVLATDGLWDVVSNEEVYDYALKAVKKVEEQPARQPAKNGACAACYAAGIAARALASLARKQRGSRDDITVMMLNLRGKCTCANPPIMLLSAAAGASSSSAGSFLASSSTGGQQQHRQAGASVSSGSQLHSSPAALGEQPVVTLEAASYAHQQPAPHRQPDPQQQQQQQQGLEQQSQQPPTLLSARKPPSRYHHQQQQQHQSPVQPPQQSLPAALHQHPPRHHPSKWRPAAVHAGLVLQPSVCPSTAAAAQDAGQQFAGEGAHSACLSDLALSSPFALMLKGAAAEVEIQIDAVAPEVCDFCKSNGSAGVVSGGSAPPTLVAALAHNSSAGLRKRSLSVALGNSRSCGSAGVACEAHGEQQAPVVVLT